MARNPDPELLDTCSVHTRQPAFDKNDECPACAAGEPLGGAPIVIYVATWEGKYDITGVGASEGEALAVCRLGVDRYRATSCLPPATADEFFGNLLGVNRLEVGKAYYDGGRAGEVR